MPTFWLAVRNTLLVAGASALIISLLGGLVGWTLLRLRFPGRTLLDFFALDVDRHSLGIAGLAVMLLYLTLPIGILRHVHDPDRRLQLSPRRIDAPRQAGLMQLHRS